jgi:predicted aspartyl protease
VRISFRNDGRLIQVHAKRSGPGGESRVSVALDTGSSWTVIDPAALAAAGYEGPPAGPGARIVTPSGLGRAAFVEVESLSALGVTVAPFRVMALRLPAEARIQGLLGLDFLRRGRLEIDFPSGVLDFSVA